MGRTTKRAIIAAAVGGLTLAVLVPAQAARSIPAVTGGGLVGADRVNVNAVQHRDGRFSGKIQIGAKRASVACVKAQAPDAVVAGPVGTTSEWLIVSIHDDGKTDTVTALTGQNEATGSLACGLGLLATEDVTHGNFKVRSLPPPEPLIAL